MFDFLLGCWHVFRTAPHRTAPHRTAPHRTAPHRTAPHRTAPHRTAPHRTAPYRTIPHRTALFYHSDKSFLTFASSLSFILRKISVPLYFVVFLLLFASPARAGPRSWSYFRPQIVGANLCVRPDPGQTCFHKNSLLTSGASLIFCHNIANS
ncbi:hypothetical protein WDW89_04575 [Deltaproteobacteria bacterium TL4]